MEKTVKFSRQGVADAANARVRQARTSTEDAVAPLSFQ
jgi:hypothetical protein